MVLISNDGPNILETDYWTTEPANGGALYLSWNAGAARLLVPDAQLSAVQEMATAEYVIISRGKEPRNAWREALELLFEDHTDSPFSVQIGANQTDRLLPAGESGSEFAFTAWTKAGKQLSLPAKYRTVRHIPCLKAWGKT